MIYIISDIHGNIDALKIFFKSIKLKSNDKIYALGDYVGYYYFSNECLDLLKLKNVICIKGNHDINLINSLKSKKELLKLSKKYGNAYIYAKKKISKPNISFLINMKKNLTLRINNFKISFSHGSPWKNDQYIYPNTEKKILNKFKRYKKNLFFIGHTHRKLKLKIGKKIIVNPGSIGQPRDGIKGVNWVEFNPANNKIKFVNKKYNSNKLKKIIKSKDKLKYKILSSYL